MPKSLLVLLAIVVYGQAQTAGPKFEVASIKPSTSPQEHRQKGEPIPKSSNDPGRYQKYVPLSYLIRTAYRLQPYQKLTGPDWMGTQYFEMLAKLPEGSTPEQVPEMLQSFLAERFKLELRRESKEETVYLLTVGKDGLKLKEAAPDGGPNSKWVPNTGGRASLMMRGTESGWVAYSRLNGNVVMEANHISLPELASELSHEVDSPIIDKTGLKGFYEVSIPVPAVWLRNAMPTGFTPAGSADASDPAGVDVFKSAAKFGLKLEKGKSAVEHLVVEHLEKTPTEN